MLDPEIQSCYLWPFWFLNGYNMDKFEAMDAFTKVVATRSFAEAGRRLGLTRSAVSKAVMELERALGARLLDRTTRRVAPTEAGLAYYERCIAILAEVEETELQVSRLHDEPRGVLKVNAPMTFGMLYLGSAVADFMARYPDLTIELTLNDRFIDPLEEGVDVTVRIGTLSDSSLIARRLVPARRVLSAAPAYIARHGAPKAPEDLAHHRCLNYGHTSALQRWQLMVDDKLISVPIASALCSNNGDVLRAAALKGNGITLLPTFMVGPDIKEGRLQVVLPDNPPSVLGIYALYAPNRYLAAKTRLFVDFLVERFGETPPWDEF
jgi:DNA-binding transcriptional LysR family regulator